MTRATLAAALAGAAAVPALWAALGLAEESALAVRLGRVLAPLRGARAGAERVSGVERRRLVALLALTLGGGGLLVAGPVAAALAATAGPWGTGRILAARTARWRRAMAEGAPVAARAMADALAGGHAVRGAITEAAVAGGAGPVVDAELARARAALAVGAPTADVLEALRRRAHGPQWDTLVAAILLQRDAGGDLAGLLRDLAHGMEAARRVEADARAATGQARFTAGTVAALPLVAAALAELGAPGTFAAIVRSPLGLLLAAAAAVFQVAGMLAVRRLARPGLA
ncbi:type II secretion system F family protein [Paraconexibacter antarcticus]|uniref:Type II secretion system F family protein n=1 Tax=Paraconexibacter antarcticus TaxID=2949664 RepID=A0ABY5DPN5_9ACTN|nr:type II secretion system F family protein [Paraconexibacter antarcticus]UTI63178.1 type II secretion system F family protein [Paraconexibacter antarcticus]